MPARNWTYDLPRELAAQLEALAAARGKSVNKLLKDALTDGVASINRSAPRRGATIRKSWALTDEDVALFDKAIAEGQWGTDRTKVVNNIAAELTRGLNINWPPGTPPSDD